MSVLILASDVSSTGGIEQVVRGVVSVCADRWGPEEVQLLTIHPHPESHLHGVRVMSPARTRQSSARVPVSRQAAYARLALGLAMRSRKSSAILCMHVNLGAVASAMSRIVAAPYAVAAYGVDVWGELPRWDAAALRRASRVWSISEFTSEQLRLRHGVEPSRILQWPLGLPRNPIATAPQAPPDVPTVLTVARLTSRNAYKGVDTLILAWPHVLRRVPRAQLHIVGDGDYVSALERLALLVGVEDHVHFLGRLSDDDRDRAYLEATVFALPGRMSLGQQADGEGFGLVFLEAQAAGLPVVAGAAGGAPEALIPGRTGFLADPEDPIDVADRVSALLSDPALRDRMGNAGREWVLTERTTDAALATVSRLIDDLVGS